MTGICENCKQEIRVMAHRGDRFCSQLCAREDEAAGELIELAQEMGVYNDA